MFLQYAYENAKISENLALLQFAPTGIKYRILMKMLSLS
ncbi:hypothetical protein D1BOALGB6SA_7065 [Olavius sp. associated proteobacterium Delta 1]|nr:hypothetical protein D1BOALGB6SA_7065 [Olavius sp. associated proteobacterium Delta 1]